MAENMDNDVNKTLDVSRYKREAKVRHIKDITKRTINQLRVEFSRKFLTAKYKENITEEYVRDFMARIEKMYAVTEEKKKIFETHKENFEHFLATGDIKRPLVLNDDESLLYWGAALTLLAVNPEMQEKWDEKNRAQSISNSVLWKRIAKSGRMTTELAKHAWHVSRSIDNPNAKIVYGEMGYPNISYCYSPQNNVIIDDMLWTMIVGPEAASTAMNHEIAHSQGTQTMRSPKMEILSKEQEVIVAKIKSAIDRDDKEEIVRLNREAVRKKIEYEYRFRFLDELENMFANRYAVSFGGEFDGAKLNELETVINLGEKYTDQKDIKEVKKELDGDVEKRIAHVKAIARNTFYAGNGIISGYDYDRFLMISSEWNSVGLYPELLTGVDKDGVAMTNKECCEELCRLCKEFEAQPSSTLKKISEVRYKKVMSSMSKKRAKMVDEFFDTFVAPHMEELYEKAEKDLNNFMNNMMQNRPQQGGQQQSGQQGGQESSQESGQQGGQQQGSQQQDAQQGGQEGSQESGQQGGQQQGGQQGGQQQGAQEGGQQQGAQEGGQQGGQQQGGQQQDAQEGGQEGSQESGQEGGQQQGGQQSGQQQGGQEGSQEGGQQQGAQEGGQEGGQQQGGQQNSKNWEDATDNPEQLKMPNDSSYGREISQERLKELLGKSENIEELKKQYVDTHKEEVDKREKFDKEQAEKNKQQEDKDASFDQDNLDDFTPDMSRPTQMSLDDVTYTPSSSMQALLKADRNVYTQYIAQYKKEINEAKKLIKQILLARKLASIRRGKGVKRVEHTLAPIQGGHTLDRRKREDLLKKIRSKDPNINIDDLMHYKTKFRRAEEEIINEEEISASNFGILIDSSGSMTCGNGAFEKALAISCILYEASKDFDELGVYIYLMGEDEPFVVATPKDKPKQVAERLSMILGGRGGCADRLLPAMHKFLVDVSDDMRKTPNKKSGFTHIFSLTDGINQEVYSGDWREVSSETSKAIKKMIMENEHITYDTFVIDSSWRDRAPIMDDAEELKKCGVNRLDYVEIPHCESGKVLGVQLSEKIFELMMKRIKHNEVIKPELNKVKKKLIDDNIKTLEGVDNDLVEYKKRYKNKNDVKFIEIDGRE